MYIHVTQVYISRRPRASRRGDGLDQRGDSPSAIDFVRHPQSSTHVKTGRDVRVYVTRSRYFAPRNESGPVSFPQPQPYPYDFIAKKRNLLMLLVRRVSDAGAERWFPPAFFVPRRLGDITNVAPQLSPSLPLFVFIIPRYDGIIAAPDRDASTWNSRFIYDVNLF